MTSSAEAIDLTLDDDDESLMDQLPEEEPEDYNGYFVDPVAGTEEDEEDDKYHGCYFRDPFAEEAAKHRCAVVASSSSSSNDVIELLESDDENDSGVKVARESPPAKETLKQAIANRTGKKTAPKKASQKTTAKKKQNLNTKNQGRAKAPTSKKQNTKQAKLKSKNPTKPQKKSKPAVKKATGAFSKKSVSASASNKRKADSIDGLGAKKKAKKNGSSIFPPKQGATKKQNALPKTQLSNQKGPEKVKRRRKAKKKSSPANYNDDKIIASKSKVQKAKTQKKKAAANVEPADYYGPAPGTEHSGATDGVADNYYGPAHASFSGKSKEDESVRFETEHHKDSEDCYGPAKHLANTSSASTNEPQEPGDHVDSSFHLPVAGLWLCPTCRRTNPSQCEYCLFCRPVLTQDILHQTNIQLDPKIQTLEQALKPEQHYSSHEPAAKDSSIEHPIANTEEPEPESKKHENGTSISGPIVEIKTVQAEDDQDVPNSQSGTSQHEEFYQLSSEAPGSLADTFRDHVQSNESDQTREGRLTYKRKELVKSDPESRNPLEPPGEILHFTNPKEVILREKAVRERSDPQGSYSEQADEISTEASSPKSLTEIVKDSWSSKSNQSPPCSGESKQSHRKQIDPPSSNTACNQCDTQSSSIDEAHSRIEYGESDDEPILVDSNESDSAGTGEPPSLSVTDSNACASSSNSKVKVEEGDKKLAMNLDTTNKSDVGNPLQERTKNRKDVKVDHKQNETESQKDTSKACNFVIIDDSSSEEEDESVYMESRWSKHWSNGISNVKPPKRKLVIQPREYSFGLSFEAAQAEQERLFRAAAERVRRMGLSNTRPVRTTVAAGLPVISTPISDIETKYPHHWKWKDPFFRLGLPRGASKKLVTTHYRRLARVYHPDKAKDSNAPEKFHQIFSAYRSILDR